MSSQPDVSQIAGSLYAAISVLSRRARLRAAADEGLTSPERSVLSRIHSDGPSTAADLARAEQIRPQGMGLILGSLQQRGLIERHAVPEDGRRLLASITTVGRTTLAAKKNRQTEHLAETLASIFDHDELRQLAATVPLLERLTEHI